MKRTWLRGIFAMSMCLCASPAMAQAPEPDGDIALAKDWANKAKTKFEAGDYRGAIDAMTEAQKHARPPTFIGFLARAHERLGKLVEAERLYRSVVDLQIAPDAPQAWREAQAEARRERVAITARIPTLQLVVPGAEPASLKVTLDGAAIDLARIEQPMSLDPGKHTLIVESAGRERVARDIELPEGAREHLTVQLRVLAPVTGSAIPGTPSATASAVPQAMPPHQGGPAERTPSTRAIAAYTALGVGGLALVAGAITGSLALVKRDQAREECGAEDFDSGRCLTARSGALMDARLAAQIATPALVLAGVGAVTGATLLILDRRRAPRAEVVVSPGFLSFRGAF